MNDVMSRIQDSKNYKALYSKTIERVATEAFRRNPEYAVNTAKNDLHKIWGAFYSSRPRFEKLLRKLKRVDSGDAVGVDSDEDLTDASVKLNIILDLLKIHSSTSERIPYLNTFYKKVFAITGTPRSIIDIGCGFNPLTVFWMNLPKETIYKAYDIDLEELDFLNKAVKLAGVENQMEFLPGDIMSDEFAEADVAFLFKIIPLVEQQEKDSTLRILDKIKAKFIVVSFPLKSLSGKDVGMAKFYSEDFEKKIAQRSWKSSQIKFDNEIIYVIEKTNE